MPYKTSLPTVLKKYGLTVEVVPGWETRGSSSFNPKGAVGHHTAGPKTGDRPSLAVCVNGRGGKNPLPGPLCNTFLARSGIVVVVAAGRANHAGPGGFRGLVGNSSVFGTEAEDDGVDGIWTTEQKWAYPRVVAAQLEIAGKDHTWYCAHRTWAPTRKIDPTGITDTWMQDRVKAVMAEVNRPKPQPPKDENDMADITPQQMDEIAKRAAKLTIDGLLARSTETYMDKNEDGKRDFMTIAQQVAGGASEAYTARTKLAELEKKVDLILSRLPDAPVTE